MIAADRSFKPALQTPQIKKSRLHDRKRLFDVALYNAFDALAAFGNTRGSAGQ
jgi:hypothetical protein